MCGCYSNRMHMCNKWWNNVEGTVYLVTHPFNGPFPGLPRWAGTRKGKTNLDFTVARDSEWQWHQLGHMQVCTLLQTDNHASTPPLSFLQAGCPSCHPTNSIKALKANSISCQWPLNQCMWRLMADSDKRCGNSELVLQNLKLVSNFRNKTGF